MSGLGHFRGARAPVEEPSTWGNRRSELPKPITSLGGWLFPIAWKYGLTTARGAQASNGEQPWKSMSVSTCR